ncbi:protein mono-ADP-ribosyltransferase PARP15-like isoform X2 [Argopecten irradians]|uniref:protein mono-ADP-ribosyltransferase PARP15-like isoform X2 n=1 Tax=Argopecten irradians TaxID=31199 RepID=UPI0037243865
MCLDDVIKMAFALSSDCSPLDIYIRDIDTDKILIVKTSATSLPYDRQLIPVIEDCCSNAVNSIYRHDHVNKVAIILFQFPITDIRTCQEELRNIKEDLFIFKIETRPEGIVVVDNDDIDPDQLYAYMLDRKSGVGPDARPEVLNEGELLIVRFRRNTEKVLPRIFSKLHTISGRPVTFEPYFPCFHDTLADNLRSDDFRRFSYSDLEEDSCADDLRGDFRHGSSVQYDEVLHHEGDHRPYPEMVHGWDEDVPRSYSPINDPYSSWRRSSGSYSPVNDLYSYSPSYNSSSDSDSYPASDGAGHSSNSPSYISPKNDRKDYSRKPPLDGRRHANKGRIRSHRPDKGTHSEGSSGYHGKQSDDKEKTTQINMSSVCADDEEEKIVSVCLESQTGKQFLEKFEKDEGCKIDINFTKKATKQKRPTSTTEKPSRSDKSDSITINGTKLSLKKGDVTREKADGLVNVVGESLELQEGMISKAYSKRGGDELTQSYGSALLAYDGKGTIACGGGKLSCKHLFTIVLKKRTDSSSDQAFTLLLESVFEKANSLSLESIALPIMGSGQLLKYPLHVAVAITVDTTTKFLKDPKNKFKEVTIVAFDDTTYDELAKEIKNKGTSPQKTQKKKTTTSDSPSPKETIGCSIELSCGSRKIEQLTKELTRVIKDQYLSANRVTIPTISIRTKAKLYEIAEEHTKLPMKMEFDSSGTSMLLKGERSQVAKISKQLTSATSGGMPSEIGKALKCSPSTWYNLAHDSPISPPYWCSFRAGTPLTVLSKTNRTGKRWTLVTVDGPTKKAIRKLVQSTWNDKLVGKGRDAVNLSHKRIKVDKVERIEHIDLYSRYASKRHEYFRILAEEGSNVLTPLEDINVQNKGAIATLPKEGSVLYEDIFPEINEHYMFHGTKPDVLQTVLRQGLDCRMGNENAMFGMGIYGAETSTKADQYTDHKQQRSNGSKKMLLVRMLLGNMFVCNDANPTKYRKPPCRKTSCLRDNCTNGHGHFDSVVGDGHWLFREFVVYTAEQCYPEYVITYHRE